MPDPSAGLDRIAARGGAAMLRLLAATRAEVAALPTRYPGDPPAALLRRARAAVARLGPQFARVLTDGILAAWVTAGRPVARAAAPAVVSPAPGLPPVRPPAPASEGGEIPTGVRWPAVEAAARDLAARKVLTKTEWAEAADDARAAAFTVARVMTRKAVGVIRDAVLSDVAEGGTLATFRRVVAEATSELTPAQVETVYRTQVGLAHAAGLVAVLDNELVEDEFPFIRYSATHDSRLRPEHGEMERLGLDGTAVYWRDDPVIRLFFPPWAWNCRCVAIPLNVEDAAAAGVKAARKWLSTGRPPDRREFVPMPAFRPPADFPRPAAGIRPVLS